MEGMTGEKEYYHTQVDPRHKLEEDPHIVEVEVVRIAKADYRIVVAGGHCIVDYIAEVILHTVGLMLHTVEVAGYRTAAVAKERHIAVVEGYTHYRYIDYT